MDKRLLNAASTGDSTSMRQLAAQNPSILLGTTPQGNNCLHIASIHDHRGFCEDFLQQEKSLLSNVNYESLLAKVNFEGETALITAVTLGHVSLASFLLGCCHQLELRQAILQQDMYGFNALHHAIRNGHKDLALELIAKEPVLSQAMTNFNESPMFIAVMRNFQQVFKKLLEIPYSSHEGKNSRNALHAAARNGNEDVAKEIMEKRPALAREADKAGNTPTMLAVIYTKVGVLRVLLEHDSSLGYEISKQGNALLCVAASRGHVKVATELLEHCPDALYHNTRGNLFTCLHEAVQKDDMNFVQFILKKKQLRKVINMQDIDGKTALHHAVQKCNPKMVAALLSCKDIDKTVIDNISGSAVRELSHNMHSAKTLNWNEVIMRMSEADRQDATALHNLYVEARQLAIYESRKNVKSLTKTYTTNTSLVAILITTITFAAAFTLPGGYSSAPEREGLPVMSRKVAFIAFLISDTLAMCFSFSVAFICIMARWEDYEFLTHYRYFTKKLMWIAYAATTTAFSTGLYTVLAPRLHWLAIAICVMVAALPIVTKLLGKWPVWRLKIRLESQNCGEVLPSL
ncbi:ankyrin repeat-containing protein [Hordeum vulgare]|nr:ankyrin repeat-containing protein [Hordeum vulgare]